MPTMRLAASGAAAMLTAATCALASAPTALAEPGPMLNVSYVNADTPVVGQPVAVVVSYPQGKKVTIRWGDGLVQKLPPKCGAPASAVRICSQPRTHAYQTTGVKVITVSTRGETRKHKVDVRPFSENPPLLNP